MLIPGELKLHNLYGFMPERTSTGMLLEQSLLKTGGGYINLWG